VTEIAIVPDTLRALAVLYYAAMLDEMRAFDVTDRLLGRFLTGLLPISEPGESLLRQWLDIRATPSDAERRELYVQAFGTSGGHTGGSPNPGVSRPLAAFPRGRCCAGRIGCGRGRDGHGAWQFAGGESRGTSARHQPVRSSRSRRHGAAGATADARGDRCLVEPRDPDGLPGTQHGGPRRARVPGARRGPAVAAERSAARFASHVKAVAPDLPMVWQHAAILVHLQHQRSARPAPIDCGGEPPIDPVREGCGFETSQLPLRPMKS
jgi:hypothetical protein